MTQNSNQPGHFGAQAPAYVFGRQNLDYNPASYNDSEDLRATVEDVKADFPHSEDNSFNGETSIELSDFAHQLLNDEVIDDYDLIQHVDSFSVAAYLKDGQIAEMSVADKDSLNNPEGDMIGIALYESDEAREDDPESYTDLDFYHANEVAEYLENNTNQED